MAVRIRGLVLGVAAGMACLTLSAQAEVPGAIQEKLHVIYDPISREVSRQMVRIYDPHPEMSLEFEWEPAAGNWPGVTPEGLANGEGTLSWRVPGAANYDPRTVHHSYKGTFWNGRFHGPGRLSYRDGAFFQGQWVQGQLQGQGEHLDALGNRYEGAFVDGQPHGQGIYRSAEGWVYEGTFKNGQRHGDGQITEPGGLQYDVVMEAGQEMSSTRPIVYADALTAGLLPAQSGGAAGKTEFSVIVDPRLSAQQEVGYTHYAQNGEVLILPSNETWRAAWNGSAEMGSFFNYVSMGEAEWKSSRAHAQFRLKTQDGSRVRLKALDLAVEYSLPHLRPILASQAHIGCVGFRPSFNFLNYGWGQVENATARVGFRNPDKVEWKDRMTAPPATAWFDVPVGDFDNGTDVFVRNALIEAGVNVTALENRRLTCPSTDLLDSCRARYADELGLRSIVAVENGWGQLQTDMLGHLSYEWVDALGERHHETQTFTTNIYLGTIEVPGGLAECGDGGAWVTQAPQYVDVDLPSNGQNYRVNIPFRGNPNISSLLSGLKFYSEQSSIHRMQMEATFADGSVRKSPPVRLFFIRARQPNFTSTATPAVCTLPAEQSPAC